MKTSFVLDKTFYILIATVFIAQLALAGCSSIQEGPTLFKDDESVDDEVVVEEIQEASNNEQAQPETQPPTPAQAETDIESTSSQPITEPEAQSETQSQEPSESPEPAVEPIEEPEQEETSQVTTIYVDGTYSASASYQNPAGSETIGVTLIVQNDIVTGVNISSQAVDATAKQFQQLFIDGIDAVVVGKSLDSLSSIGAVNGSTLTPSGFNVALQSIKANAKL